MKKANAGEVESVYFGNVLSSFETGCRLDFRVRLAVEFLKGGTFRSTGITGEAAALAALECATALVSLATDRGLLKALPEDDELTMPMRAHIRRNIRAGAYQQFAQQRITLEEQPAPLAVVPPGGFPPPAGGNRQ